MTARLHGATARRHGRTARCRGGTPPRHGGMPRRHGGAPRSRGGKPCQRGATVPRPGLLNGWKKIADHDFRFTVCGIYPGPQSHEGGHIGLPTLDEALARLRDDHVSRQR
jgi:hypothetical protein